eukprot:COSAG02_NODE_478_length_21511_cov_120.811087_11_plen_207_part_00
MTRRTALASPCVSLCPCGSACLSVCLFLCVSLLYTNGVRSRYLKLGKAAAALKDAEACITWKGDFARGWLRKGQAHGALSQWRDAVEAYRSGLDIDPSNDQLKQAYKAADEAERMAPRSSAPASAPKPAPSPAPAPTRSAVRQHVPCSQIPCVAGDPPLHAMTLVVLTLRPCADPWQRPAGAADSARRGRAGSDGAGRRSSRQEVR